MRSEIACERATRHTRLELVRPPDYEFLYQVLLGGDASYRWRFRGATPEPEVFTRTIWSGVLAQFVVWTASPMSRAGLIAATDPELDIGVVNMSFILAPDARGGRSALEAPLLFLDYLFTHWNLRKVYLHVPGYNAAQVSSLTRRGFEEEGVLREHDYFAGRFWPLHILALHRASWDTRGPTWLDRIEARPAADDCAQLASERIH